VQYVISLPASRDLEAIADYFAEVNVTVGERFLDEFERRCQQIVSFPNSGRSYSELRANLRGLPLEGYIILYQVI
jgi:toxin ParE1/3/4